VPTVWLRCHCEWQPCPAQIAAEGGRGPKVRQERGRADASIARSAPPGAAAPLPRERMTSGDLASRHGGGTRVAGVGTRVPTSVGVQGLGHGGAGPGPPGLRSLPAKQHAPKARPHPATDRDRRPAAGWSPGQARSRQAAGLAGWMGRLRRPPDPAADEPGRPIALDSGAAVPQLHHRSPGEPGGQYAGGRGLPPDPLRPAAARPERYKP
jgi:hypothetical protein